MQFTINRDALLAPLQQIVNVIEKKQTMAILSNVLMVIDAEQLSLTGTDTEIQFVAKLAVTSASQGAFTVPARKFLDICRLLPNGVDMKFEVLEDKVKILSARSRFSLNCLPAHNYPDFSESAMEQHFIVNAGKLKKALDKTIFCMANQDVRYYLNGLLLHISNSKLKLVASDGHRLSFYEESLDIPSGCEARIIIPKKGVVELSKMLDDADVELKVEFSGNHIRVSYKNLIFSAKLVDSKYPDFGRVFLQDFFNQIHVQKQLLKEALTRVSILANDKIRGVSIEIQPESMKISAHNAEHDEAEEDLFIEYTGEPLTISFNVQYLLEAVSNLDAELAVLTIASNSSCCFIVEPDSSTYKFIVMSMRL